METYLYLSMIPESLVASMLDPQQFGTYLATGTKKSTRGQAMYFDLKKDFQSDYFDLESIKTRCVMRQDGQPKRSVYLSIYRVLEHVPLEAINHLWLATKDGRILQLSQKEEDYETPEYPEFSAKYHLYQELCPVHPLIASTLVPEEFCKSITDPTRPIHVPRICFVDLELSDLGRDPMSSHPKDLPYSQIDHIKDCLIELAGDKHKLIKTVNRIQPQVFPYRCIRSGFYLGDKEKMLYFPFPSLEELDAKHHEWWHSATV